jgi:uncharacterized cupin superfamily protein
VIPEARLVPSKAGLVPEGEGWFVVNARKARWKGSDGAGRYCQFEGDVDFAEYGVNIHVLGPGEPNAMYHREDVQEDFLVLSGECLLLVEGQERRLSAWDFVHCPASTEHVFVGAGTGPCAILMIGSRREARDLVYPASELAQRHGAGVSVETTSPDEAYAGSPEFTEALFREGDLPG